MRKSALFTVLSLLLGQCAASPMHLDAEEVEVLNFKFPVVKGLVSSLEELKTLGKVLHYGQTAVLTYYSPWEGVGYGSIHIYIECNEKWKRLFSTNMDDNRLLLPQVVIENGELIATKQKGLNDSKRVESFRMSINDWNLTKTC